MPKKAKELTALEVKRLTKTGKYPIGSGVYLEINSENSKVWILRTTVGGKRRSIGLGSYPTITLAQAREKAHAARELIAQGIDPIEHRKAAQSAIKASQAKEITFKECAIAYIDAYENSWKNAKHRQQWESSLSTYAFPTIGDLFVKDVEQQHVLNILRPIWNDKTETASRIRGRIETVLDWAAVSGYREKDNPATWRGRLDKLLPAPSKLKKIKHHKAVAIDEMPVFMQQLKTHDVMSAKCLEFSILTASRSGEAREATWEEINFKEKVWTIPASRMKAGSEHQIPLSGQAVQLLESISKVEGVRIDTIRRAAQINLCHMSHHLERCYGKLFSALENIPGYDAKEYIRSITVQGLPSRLAPNYLDSSLNWETFKSILQTRKK